MTKFVGEAVGSRQSRQVASNSTKDRIKRMDKFLVTGSHDDVELAQRLRETTKMPELPEHDPNRSFVFMDFAIGSRPAGRLVIELFDDVIPMGATHLRNRCLPGSRMGITGPSINKLVPHYAVFIGKNAAASEGMMLRPVNALRALVPGTVSLSLSGDEVAIALDKALTLDTTGYQVVGRVHKGKEVLDMLNDLDVGPDSMPYQKVTITRSGNTNVRGDFEGLEGSGPVSKADAIARLKEQSASARSAVLEALEVGLGSSAAAAGAKRKAAGEDAAKGPGSSAAAAAAGPSKQQKAGDAGEGAETAAAKRAVQAATSKSKALNAVLGDLSSDSDDSDGGD